MRLDPHTSWRTVKRSSVWPSASRSTASSSPNRPNSRTVRRNTRRSAKSSIRRPWNGPDSWRSRRNLKMNFKDMRRTSSSIRTWCRRTRTARTSTHTLHERRLHVYHPLEYRPQDHLSTKQHPTKKRPLRELWAHFNRSTNRWPSLKSKPIKRCRTRLERWTKPTNALPTIQATSSKFLIDLPDLFDLPVAAQQND